MLFRFFCKDGLYAQQRVNEIIGKLNKFQYRILVDDIVPFRAGICLPDAESKDFSTAFGNAELGYKYAKQNDVSTLIFTSELIIKEESKKRLYNKLSNAINNMVIIIPMYSPLKRVNRII